MIFLNVFQDVYINIYIYTQILIIFSSFVSMVQVFVLNSVAFACFLVHAHESA